jgi:hypothetical protein
VEIAVTIASGERYPNENANEEETEELDEVSGRQKQFW